MRFRSLLHSPATLLLALVLSAQLVLASAASNARTDVAVPTVAEDDLDEFPFPGPPIADDEDEIDSDPWWRSVTGDEKHTLEKRRGGGGRGGGGGGGRSGGGRTGGGGSSGSGGRTSSTSNTGGRTTSGSGTPKTFGGAYGGGAAVPYRAGGRSGSGIAPAFLGGAALGLLPGLWLFGAYSYPYSRHVPFHNNTSGQNETLPVLCLCEQYSVCGCDENHNATYTQALYDNATVLPAGLDKQFVSAVADVNGTKTLVVNGTLANGTTADGGTDDDSGAVVQGRNLGTVVVVGLIVAAMAYL